MEPRGDKWHNEDLDFFGMDAFPHGFLESFPTPSDLDDGWWTDSSTEEDYYSILPHVPTQGSLSDPFCNITLNSRDYRR